MLRSNNYATITAHILQCRTHHPTSNTYSIGLKNSKDPPIHTSFHPSIDNLIPIDTQLTLHTDKHSYQHFPKFTMIVNSSSQSGEKKTIGTTFVNYKKEGIQTYQVSECNCKSKAFEIDVVCMAKIIDVKNSKNKGGKNQATTNSITSSRTPSKISRPEKEGKAQKEVNKGIKDPQANRLKQIRSQKVIPVMKKELSGKEGAAQALSGEATELKKRVQELEDSLTEAEEAIETLQQLLVLQEEKTVQSMFYIKTLEKALEDTVGFKPNNDPLRFNIIEERDQFIQMNEELKGEIAREKAKNIQLEKDIGCLRAQVGRLERENEHSKKCPSIEEVSVLRLKSEMAHHKDSTNNVMLTSRCRTEEEQQRIKDKVSLEIEELTKLKSNLEKEIKQLENVLSQLNDSIEKTTKQHTKILTPVKSPSIKKEEPRSTEKPTAKVKIAGRPPPKTPKKNSMVATNNTSGFKSSDGERTLGETPKRVARRANSALQQTPKREKVSEKEVVVSSQLKIEQKMPQQIILNMTDPYSIE